MTKLCAVDRQKLVRTLHREGHSRLQISQMIGCAWNTVDSDLLERDRRDSAEIMVSRLRDGYPDAKRNDWINEKVRAWLERRNGAEDARTPSDAF